MYIYLIRRILYAFPVLIGVNILTFLLFFAVNSPDDMARLQLGEKHISQISIDRWKTQHGYDKPLFFNPKASGMAQLTDTLFVQKSLKLFVFDFGVSDGGSDIGFDISQRMWPSLLIAIPILFLGMFVEITFAMGTVFFRGTYLDTWGMFVAIVMMSISSLFYIIAGQFLLAKVLQLLPISGYSGGLSALKFIILPVIVGVVSGVGAGSRWYRTLLLEEVNKDYVRTAYAKGLTEFQVYFKHVLKNALIPILTGVVVILPLLFMGSLILESFFAIPGLGSYTIDAINQQDFAIVRAMVFLGTILYLLGLILTDISYTLVDPRIRFK